MTVRHHPLGDEALTVVLGDPADEATSPDAASFADALLEAAPRGLLDAVPTMDSVLLRYDPDWTDVDRLVAAAEGLLARGPSPTSPARRVVLPACYDHEFGRDLRDVAEAAGISTDEVVALHCGTDVRVRMVGFLPGFAYLGPIPAELRLPRRATPRLRVPARSVAIAGPMTAVYPSDSPGGWHLLGAVPVDLFDLRRSPPALLAPGDVVRFSPVSRETYEQLRRDWLQGTWAPAFEALG